MFTALFAGISGVVQKILIGMMAATIIGLLITGGIFYWKWSSAEKDILTLQSAVVNLQTEVAAKKLEATNLNNAMKTLEETNNALIVKRVEESAIDKDIDNAKHEDDDHIAPVLRRALDNVDRMLNSSSQD